MFGRIVILIDSSMADSVFSKEVSPHDALVCLELDIDDEIAIDELNRAVFTSRHQTQFSIKLKSTKANNVTDAITLIEKILAVTFSINYFRDIPSMPVFFFDKCTLSSTIQDLVNGCFVKQGYEQVKFIEINAEAVVDERFADNITRANGNNALVDSFTNALLEESFVFINTNNQHGEMNFATLLDKIIQQIKQTNYSTGLLLEENYKWREITRILRTENYFQKLQLDRLTHSSTHIHPTSAAYYIKTVTNFYKNEYEVLPLWYKRFGHIIKVIMGKRRLRSLFNDKIKKYKE